MLSKAVIFGLSGLTLTEDEKYFFHSVNPYGFILFDRNIKNPQQVRQLTFDLRECVGRDAPILIDQEGGRIQRMWPPYWEGLPWGDYYGDLYLANEAAAIAGVKMHAQKLAKMLLDVGIDVDCWPCLDVAQKETHLILKKRLFSENREIVSILGNVGVDAALESGLMPVIKHIPGYGRAKIDPHQGLPVVRDSLSDLECDFYPFRQALKPVWGMTAHVTYTAIDDKPATLSRKVLDFVRNDIGFDGFLLCDDMSMGALTGCPIDLARDMLAAGVDCVLHCNGNLDEMKAVSSVISVLSDKALCRIEKARACKR